MHSMRLIDSLQPAFDYTKAVLFKPFSVQKWVIFAVIIFIEMLGIGGPGGGLGGFRSDDEREELSFEEIMGVVVENLSVILIVGGIILAVVVALRVLFIWLGVRGSIMFIRALALNSEALGEHWSSTARPANSLFRFRLVLMVIAFVIFGGMAIGVGMILIGWHKANQPFALLSLAPFIGVAILVTIVLCVVHMILRNFVAPVMYLHDETISESWRRVSPVLKKSVPAILGFVAYKIAFSFSIWFVSIVPCCFMCSTSIIPVVHQAIFAPAYVFDRTLSLMMLGSAGPDFTIITPDRYKTDAAPMPQGPPLPPDPNQYQ